MRRVDCRHCGVVVEEVPWGDGKHQLTKAYMLFLARWARKLSWKETAEAFHTSWDQVCDAVEYVVGWGLQHRMLESIRAIGVDEIQYAKGHKYLTLVYQIDQGFTRLLWVGKLAHLGRHVPGFLVPPNDAIPHRADEEDRPDVARSPRAAAQLFQGQKADFQRCGRGAEQQSQSNHEKILWLSHLPHPGTRALSLTWQTT